MRVEWIVQDGMLMRAVIVNAHSPSTDCENCGKPSYNHSSLAKEDKDWCLKCNDYHYRSNMSEKELGAWTNQQQMDGKAVIVVWDSNGPKKKTEKTNRSNFYTRR